MAQLKPVAAAVVALAVESALHGLLASGAARVTFVIVSGAASYLLALLALGLAPRSATPCAGSWLGSGRATPLHRRGWEHPPVAGERQPWW